MVEKTGKNLIFVAIIIAGIFIAGAVIYTNQRKASALSPQAAAEKAINFINQNLLKEDVKASLTSAGEENGVYKFHFKVGEEEVDSYVTQNGKILFLQGISLEEKSATGEKPEINISIEGEPILGNPDARVTMIEFSDFQCPFCARYDLTAFPQIKKEYVDTEKVKIVFKNFPLPIHQNAEIAAEASECAFEQGKFWEYREKLFSNQQNLSIENLKQYAKDLGLDQEKFNNCLDSGKFKEEVKGDLNEGVDVGIDGTPTFFINGEKIVGAQPFSEFQKVIEDKLK